MKTLIDRLEEIRHSRDYSSKREYINVLIPIDLLDDVIDALQRLDVGLEKIEKEFPPPHMAGVYARKARAGK